MPRKDLEQIWASREFAQFKMTMGSLLYFVNLCEEFFSLLSAFECSALFNRNPNIRVALTITCYQYTEKHNPKAILRAAL